MRRHLLSLAAISIFAWAPYSNAAVSTASLDKATTLIHWPTGLEPSHADVFVHNEAWIDAPPAVVWKNLVDAQRWPTWYANAVSVRIQGASQLADGVSFSWTTFGFPITSHVDVFDPEREIGWSVDKPGFRVHHAWVLVPRDGGTFVMTEETQIGADAVTFNRDQPRAMFDGHDWWITALKVRSEREAHGRPTARP